MNKKFSLFDYFHMVALLTFITFVGLFLSYFLYRADLRFKNESEALQSNYFVTKKKLLVNEVERFVEYVERRKSEVHTQTQTIVRDRTNEAYTLASNLYEKYKNTHSEIQIQQMIVESLRSLRYENNKGYYFIARLDGVEVLFGDKPQMEGQNILNLRNSEGKYVIKEMIALAQSAKEGFYEYFWSKPFETQENFKKVSFIKLFEPYGWIIGTGLYLDDIEQKIKEEILSNEDRLRFDKEGNNYIFIGTWSGKALTYPAKGKEVYNITDQNGKLIVQELIKTAQNGGGFVEYMMPPLGGEKNLHKLSYVKSILDWQWYIGAGTYTDEVNDEVIKLEMKIKQELKQSLFSIGSVLMGFCVLLGIFYIYFSKIVRRDFTTFANFFDSLVYKDETIDASVLRFKEFDELAQHANAMLKAKMVIHQNLLQYQEIVSSSEDLLALIDRNYVYLAVSGGYPKFFNKPEEEIVGHSMIELYGQTYFEKNLKHLSDRALKGEVFEYEYWVKPAKVSRYLHTKYFPHFEKEGDALPSAYIVSARDITEKKISEDRLIASEKKLVFLAHNDVLTGLPNRVLLNDRITHGIEHCNRQETMLAVCFIDLDNFKKINDSFGHKYGDDVLKQFASRVQKVIRGCDTLSRIGGDEFILLIENIHTKSEVETIVSKIQGVFEKHFLSRKQKFFLSASIGISLYPDHGLHSETLIKNADVAMYKAKEEGKNTYAFYTVEMSIASYERIGMENELREAIKEEQFVVYYQPQIDLKSKKLIGVEALVRWDHPREGVLSPARFIQFAEQTRLIIDIGAFVLKRAVQDLLYLQQKGIFDLSVSINISGVQIEYSDFLSTLREVLEETMIDPKLLEMEITESFIMNDPEQWIILLKNMQSLGVNIAIDDFGTGHSSLSYLRKLPINKLKVDMSFVKDIPAQEDACAIVNSIIDLAQNMRIATLAEGIEREDQEAYLSMQNCEQGQGYLYGKPMPLDALEEWIVQYNLSLP